MTLAGEHSSVLLLDSDRDRRTRLTELLSARGWSVDETRTIAEAVVRLAQRPASQRYWALVLADRVADGSALDLIAELPTTRRPFVLTHGPQRHPRTTRMPDGIDAWLPHPLAETDVASLLEELRADGARPDLGAIERGTHAALLFRGRIKMLDQLADYFALGLALGERCVMACDDEAQVDQARAHFARSGLPVANAERNGSLVLMTHDECYFVGGRFDPKAMLQLVQDSIAGAVADGFTGLRGAGEGSWLPTTPEDEASWFWYEHEVNRRFGGGNFTALCLYSLEKFPERALVAALGSHPVVIDGQLVLPNPSYARMASGGQQVVGPPFSLQLRLAELRAQRHLPS